MVLTSPGEGLVLVGRGRSAAVYRAVREPRIARKVFGGDTASQAVLYLLTGAPNPYAWCEAAVRTAVHRRRILARLVRVWFGDKLRLPETHGWSWNEAHKAFELRQEFVDGCHAPLCGPAGRRWPDLPGDLPHRVMRPLARRLEEAGFDGLVWQAGRGNPVAAGNFLLEAGGASPRWVWIDLESGVPALFAMNPFATLAFYLPRSVHHRHWLFDDVDIRRLERYLEEDRVGIETTLGRPALAELRAEAAELARRQREWKAIERHRRGITHELSQRRLSAAQASWYERRRCRWYIRQAAVLAGRGVGRLAVRLDRGLEWLLTGGPWRLLRHVRRYLFSERYRARLARRYVRTRIQMWRQRRFIDEAGEERLQAALRQDDAGSYLTDFSVHLALKPLVKGLQWGVFPALWAAGTIDPVLLAGFLVAGGAVVRTLYTASRGFQATARGQRRPWVALAAGLLPVAGNLAYPLQLLHTSTGQRSLLARFIVLDLAATAGRAVPIWGGADSRVEHAFNRAGDALLRFLMPAGERARRASVTPGPPPAGALR